MEMTTVVKDRYFRVENNACVFAQVQSLQAMNDFANLMVQVFDDGSKTNPAGSKLCVIHRRSIL